MKRLAALILSALLLFSLTACGGQTQEAPASSSTWQEHYDLGIKYLNDGNYEEAIIAFIAAIEIDPKQPDAYIGAADAYIAMGDLDAAIKILQKGYKATKEERFQTQIDALEQNPELPEDLPNGATVITMYSAEWGFAGHDSYAFDDQGRMISNIWYNEMNEVEVSFRWTYDDAADTTTLTTYELEYNEETGEEAPNTTTETLPGCEDHGWYWDGLDDFSTDPSMEAVDGRVEWNEGRYVIYTYDAAGRVSQIHTYDAADTLLGYCVVTYRG